MVPTIARSTKFRSTSCTTTSPLMPFTQAPTNRCSNWKMRKMSKCQRRTSSSSIGPWSKLISGRTTNKFISTSASTTMTKCEIKFSSSAPSTATSMPGRRKSKWILLATSWSMPNASQQEPWPKVYHSATRLAKRKSTWKTSKACSNF